MNKDKKTNTSEPLRFWFNNRHDNVIPQVAMTFPMICIGTRMSDEGKVVFFDQNELHVYAKKVKTSNDSEM